MAASVRPARSRRGSGRGVPTQGPPAAAGEAAPPRAASSASGRQLAPRSAAACSEVRAAAPLRAASLAAGAAQPPWRSLGRRLVVGIPVRAAYLGDPVEGVQLLFAARSLKLLLLQRNGDGRTSCAAVSDLLCDSSDSKEALLSLESSGFSLSSSSSSSAHDHDDFPRPRIPRLLQSAGGAVPSSGFYCPFVSPPLSVVSVDSLRTNTFGKIVFQLPRQLRLPHRQLSTCRSSRHNIFQRSMTYNNDT